jgi:HAE1 family hydrophobic/amphiphilic exporter-1
MGMTVFSGMLVATVLGVLIVPALYVFVERYIARSEAPPETRSESPGTATGDPPTAGQG